ncbi:Hypothetical_protein [Hexamita inflata]|uniref:Hypothetical_protein n=1 Tax=Hexamita inflata TaxID=28002 RepID=A0AA86NHT7_9EUKA|nr:Hypothetical protein HINF_LOCUS7555 [Hexamita inflata]
MSFKYDTNGDNLSIAWNQGREECDASFENFDLHQFRRIVVKSEQKQFDLTGAADQHNKFMEVMNCIINLDTFTGVWEKVQLCECSCFGSSQQLQIKQLSLTNTSMDQQSVVRAQKVDITFDAKFVPDDYSRFANLNTLTLSSMQIDLSTLAGNWVNVVITKCECLNSFSGLFKTQNLEITSYSKFALKQLGDLNIKSLKLDIFARNKEILKLIPVNSVYVNIHLYNYTVQCSMSHMDEIVLIKCDVSFLTKLQTNIAQFENISPLDLSQLTATSLTLKSCTVSFPYKTNTLNLVQNEPHNDVCKHLNIYCSNVLNTYGARTVSATFCVLEIKNLILEQLTLDYCQIKTLGLRYLGELIINGEKMFESQFKRKMELNSEQTQYQVVLGRIQNVRNEQSKMNKQMREKIWKISQLVLKFDTKGAE